MIKVRYSEFSAAFYNAMVDAAPSDLGKWNAARNVYPVDAAYCCMPI